MGITRSICKYAVTVRKREELGDIIKKAFVIAKSRQAGCGGGGSAQRYTKRIRQRLLPGKCGDKRLQTSDRRTCGPGPEGNGGIEAGQKTAFPAWRRSDYQPGEGRNALSCRGHGNSCSHNDYGKRRPSHHASFVCGKYRHYGSYAANKAVSRCDLLFSIGTRFNDRITGKPAALRPGPPLSMWILIRPPYPGIFPWIFRLLPMQDRRSARFVKEPVLWKQVRGESRLENGRNSIP